MQDKNSKTDKTKTSSKKLKHEQEEHPYETMSQIQNRYGKGRKKSGSDGGRNDGFSNH
jgi:hypothetical protein